MTERFGVDLLPGTATASYLCCLFVLHTNQQACRQPASWRAGLPDQVDSTRAQQAHTLLPPLVTRHLPVVDQIGPSVLFPASY